MEHSPTIYATNTNEHEPGNTAEANWQAAEQKPQLQPKFWAACLASYNNGILHGEWIRANQHADSLHEDVQAMLTASPIAGAEEFAIHDYENFGPIRLSEYENLDTVARLATGLATHGEPFGHWAHIVGTNDTEQLDKFDEHYLGHWDSLADYAEHLLDDLGQNITKLGPSWLQPYIRIDYAGLGRDMGCDLEAAEAQDGGVELFSIQ